MSSSCLPSRRTASTARSRSGSPVSTTRPATVRGTRVALSSAPGAVCTWMTCGDDASARPSEVRTWANSSPVISATAAARRPAGEGGQGGDLALRGIGGLRVESRLHPLVHEHPEADESHGGDQRERQGDPHPHRLAALSSRTPGEPVADAAHRLQAVPSEGPVHLRAQVADVDVHDIGPVVVRRVPGVLEQLLRVSTCPGRRMNVSSSASSFAESATSTSPRRTSRAASRAARSPTCSTGDLATGERRVTARIRASSSSSENGLAR